MKKILAIASLYCSMLALGGLGLGLMFGVAADPLPTEPKKSSEPKLAAPRKLPANLSASGPGTDPTEAFASYKMLSNGFISQEEFDAALDDFNDTETPKTGLGPTFNAPSCAICHPNCNGSTLSVLRVGSMRGGTFFGPAGGTLVRKQAILPEIVQHAPDGFEIQAEIIAPTLRGLGYINYVRDADLIAINAAQPPSMRGTLVTVSVVLSFNPDGTPAQVENRIGRFFRKCFHGVVLEANIDALGNELGPTSPLFPTKAPAVDGSSLAKYQETPNLLDNPPIDGKPMGKEPFNLTRLVNALPAPPRGKITPDVLAGEKLFTLAQCNVCHTPTMQTAPKGSRINGFLSIPDSLAGLTFHPFGDCATHKLGNSDGIQQGPAPVDSIRTTFLWGLSTRVAFWHDGRAKTVKDAIMLHGLPGSEAKPSVDVFKGFTDQQQQQLLAFLGSL